MVAPLDFGTHHCLNSSGLVHASNTRRGGASKVRVTTISRSDVRSDRVRFFMGADSLSVLATITLLLALQFIDDRVQRIETRGPQLAVVLDPGRLLLEPARAEPAGPHSPHLLRGDELRL